MTRLRLSVVTATAVSLCALSAGAQPKAAHKKAAAKAPSVLPLRRVRLYESGIGYFERRGMLASGDVGLPVPAGHLDDALKSLVVLGGGKGTKVSGVEFKSSVSRSMALALAGLSGNGSEPLGFKALLATLKGASVQLQTHGKTVRGRLVDVLEPKQSSLSRCETPAQAPKGANNAKAPCVMVKQSTVVLLTDKRELRRFALSDVSSVRPTDPAFASRLEAALGALSDHGAQTQKTLHVSANSQAPVTLGYIAEAPIWRSTYRVVLEQKGAQGVIQGWALIHNDTDEDWKRVTVDLVNGRPDSFLFPLAGPRYARRKLVTPQRQLSSVPQLLDKTVDNMWTGESAGEGALGLGAIGEGGGGSGYGIGMGSISTVGHGAGVSGSTASSALSVGNLAAIEQVDGTESGALFRYTLPHPIDLHAHSSGLVPFMEGKIPAERIAWFSSPGGTAHSALRLVNKTRQTLPPGPISVFADGGFAGESALSRTKPREVRFIRFGLDLDVDLDVAHQKSADEPRVMAFRDDRLVEDFVRHSVVTYKLENRSGSGRTVYLTLAVVNNARVRGADRLDFDHEAGRALAVFHVGAHKQLDKTLKIDEGLSHSHAFSTLTSKLLAKWARSPLLPKAQRAALAKASDYLLKAEVRRAAIPARKADLARVKQKIVELREDVKALGVAHASGTDKMSQRLIDAQDRADKLEKRTRDLATGGPRAGQPRPGRAEGAAARLRPLPGVDGLSDRGKTAAPSRRRGAARSHEHGTRTGSHHLRRVQPRLSAGRAVQDGA